LALFNTGAEALIKFHLSCGKRLLGIAKISVSNRSAYPDRGHPTLEDLARTSWIFRGEQSNTSIEFRGLWNPNLPRKSTAPASHSSSGKRRNCTTAFNFRQLYLRKEDSRATSNGSSTTDRGRLVGALSMSVDIIRAARSPISAECWSMLVSGTRNLLL
jgi:hypothetical protein